ncbi:PAS domain S-box-containing protein [Tindallia magadiensis]|uniref:Circadian input-output histidine kinase CikA n=1 Tax=Tindallia magadiensis TaxID=69895 RepID=A0A1I3GUI2_9FIRM|nr:ATP-binding protein [Tindallia magadiensis]SFI27114.1 PAS domain S-box-containing protein [Tindallia magadiensis]
MRERRITMRQRKKTGITLSAFLTGVLLAGFLLCHLPLQVQAHPAPEIPLLEFEEMFNRHGMVMLVIDPETGAITWANSAAEAFYGYGGDVLTTMKIQDINQLTPEEIAERRQEAAIEERNYFIFPHKLANGEIRTVEVYSWPFDRDDRTLLLSAVIDITDKIASQEALALRNRQFWTAAGAVMVLMLVIIVGLRTTKQKLKANNQELTWAYSHLQAIIDASHAAVWGYDLTTDEFWCSPEYFVLMGFEKNKFETLQDKSLEGVWLSRLHPDDREPALKKYQNYLKNPQGDYENTFRIKHKEGHWIWVLSRGGMLKHAGEKGDHQLVGIHLDVTSQKQVEEDLRRMKSELEASLEVKDQFLANMSHELRTPLNGLCGMLQLMELTELTEEQAELSQMVLQSANALTKLVNDILMYNKLLNTESEPVLQLFRPESLVKEVMSLYRHMVVEKGLAMELGTGGHVPDLVQGEAVKLRELLMHIISNAVKFTQAGRIDVSVDASGGENQEEIMLIIGVKDTGIGMNEALVERIFDPFFQGDEVHHKRFTGTGIGLSIARALVEQMNGSIEVSSEEGNGSFFEILVPVMRVVEEGDIIRENNDSG